MLNMPNASSFDLLSASGSHRLPGDSVPAVDHRAESAVCHVLPSAPV